MERETGGNFENESVLTRRKGKPREAEEVSRGEDNGSGSIGVDGRDISLVCAVKKTLEREKIAFVRRLEAEVNELTDNIMSVVENGVVPRSGLPVARPPSPDKRVKKSSREPVFHDKSFEARDSILTDLFKVKHISTIYHIFIAFLINLFISTAVYDVVKLGEINLGFRLIYWNFESLPFAGLIWAAMQGSTIAVYYLFKVWATMRSRIPNGSSLKSWDFAGLLFLVTYQSLFLAVPASAILRHRLPIAISFTLLMEQIRFVMKTYSFIRTTCPRVLADPGARLPSLRMYSYFLFAPTLVYRDEYPRTSRVRWRVVAKHFLEIVGVVFYLAFVMENYLLPSVRNFGKTRTTPVQLATIFFSNSIPCLFVFLCGFYSFLHSWMNAFAEILRFADRMFYQDWWNSSSFAEYYKTWNVVVHDWLYAFIYKDGTEMVTRKRSASTWLVFIVSALFHEYILALTFKFCYPVLFIVFGILSTGLVFIPRKRSSALGNLFLWFCLITGTGCCGSLYMLEYYARINCPRPNHASPVADFFIPRSWTCGAALAS